MNIRTVSIMAFVALLNLSLWGEIVPVNKSPNKKPNFVVILSMIKAGVISVFMAIPISVRQILISLQMEPF